MKSKKFELLALGAVAGPIFWLALLYPLLPKTPLGWFLSLVSGAIVGLSLVASAFLIKWLQQQKRFRLFYISIAVVVALSIGCGVFWLAVRGQAFVIANFSYFGR